MPETLRERVVEWNVAIGERALPPLERWLAKHSTVGDTPFFDPADFPWTRSVEAEWRAIRAELDDVMTDRDELPNFQDISVDQATITDDDRWKTFFLYGFGFRVDSNCERCPQTARLVEAIPGMKTAFFSILAPGKHIPAHRGPWKGVLRYHLGLMVPEPATSCRIRVDQEVRHWEEGRSLVFDDTYDHEAWNDSDGYRVVLFVDFVRPLDRVASTFNRGVLGAIAWSPFIQDAKSRHQRWESRFQTMKGQG